MGFAASVDRVLSVEGGYSNDPKDSGGETHWGITVAVARACGYVNPMRSMTREQAKPIYKTVFWDALQLDAVELLFPLVAEELFDSAVNCGTDRAGQWLQRVVNAMNQEGSLYGDIKVDGRIGPVTLAALREYKTRRAAPLGQTVLLRALNSLQGAHYLNLAETRPKDERFVFGWFANRVG